MQMFGTFFAPPGISAAEVLILTHALIFNACANALITHH